MDKVEKVLVVPTSTLDHFSIGQGFFPQDMAYRLQYLMDKAFFMDRPAAEQDPRYKQVIPYHLVMRSGNLLEYARTKQSGEERLRSKRSVGFGGHINEEDAAYMIGMDAYVFGAMRELHDEELHIASPTITNRICGFLNDDSEEVGRVHLGVVHLVQIDGVGGVCSSDKAIDLLGFEQIHLLRSGAPPPAMETWSALCLQHDNINAIKKAFEEHTEPKLSIPNPYSNASH